MLRTMNVEKALLYEKYRLSYAAEMVSDLLSHTGEVEVVADIGAGTGQLARLFAVRCARVIALEPDPAMCKVGSNALAGFPAVKFLGGVAEAIALAENSVDLLLVGNAFHRFKAQACAEIRRILKKPGWVALVGYSFTDRAYTEMLFPKLAALKGVAARIEKSWPRTPVENLFGQSPTQELHYCQAVTEDWTTFFGGACAGIEAPERGDPEFEQFEEINRDVFESFAVNGKIRIEYETRVTFGKLISQCLL